MSLDVIDTVVTVYIIHIISYQDISGFRKMLH